MWRPKYDGVTASFGPIIVSAWDSAESSTTRLESSAISNAAARSLLAVELILGAVHLSVLFVPVAQDSRQHAQAQTHTPRGVDEACDAKGRRQH